MTNRVTKSNPKSSSSSLPSSDISSSHLFRSTSEVVISKNYKTFTQTLFFCKKTKKLHKRICSKKLPLLVNFASQATHVCICRQGNGEKQSTVVHKLVQHSTELARAHALIWVSDWEISQKKILLRLTGDVYHSRVKGETFRRGNTNALVKNFIWHTWLGILNVESK